MLSTMGDSADLSGDQWEVLLKLPFAAYTIVATAGDVANEAQFRCFREEIEHGRASFGDGTTGAALTDAVAENLDMLWSAYRASGRSPEDLAKRGVKVLGKVPEGESVAVRDWLLLVALRVAAASRVVGEPPVSWSEVYALKDLARWLKRPVPDIARP